MTEDAGYPSAVVWVHSDELVEEHPQWSHDG